MSTTDIDYDYGEPGLSFEETSEHTFTLGKTFKIDFGVVTTLTEVVEILKAMDLTINWSGDDVPEQFQKLYDSGLLIEVKNN